MPAEASPPENTESEDKMIAQADTEVLAAITQQEARRATQVARNCATNSGTKVGSGRPISRRNPRTSGRCPRRSRTPAERIRCFRPKN